MNAFENLLDDIDQKVTQLKEWVGAGQAKDFGDYQKTCGEVRGLLIARQFLTDLQKRMEHSDDE
jgi:hypothetical protein